MLYTTFLKICDGFYVASFIGGILYQSNLILIKINEKCKSVLLFCDSSDCVNVCVYISIYTLTAHSLESSSIHAYIYLKERIHYAITHAHSGGAPFTHKSISGGPCVLLVLPSSSSSPSLLPLWTKTG